MGNIMLLSQIKKFKNYFIILLLTLPLISCSGMPRTPITEPLLIKKLIDEEKEREMLGVNAGRNEILSEPGPRTPSGRSLGDPITSSKAPPLSGESISINFEGVRLPAFINTVFGELLEVTFEIDSQVLQKEQLVTLRTSDALKPDDFYQLVTQVLTNYGVSVVYQNNVYRVIQNTQAQSEIPRIVRSRAFSSVPGDMRPVFLYVKIDNVRVKSMQVWLEQALKGRLRINGVPYTNALMLLGTAEDIAAASEVIEILDQPNFAGNRSLKISPAFWTADKLTQQLITVLKAEGYAVESNSESDAPIKLIPVQALNQIIVFASKEENLQHVMEWASELDRPGQTINATGVYYHPIENTNAEDIASIIGQLLGENSAQNQGENANDNIQTSKVIVDTGRNAIIFQGTAEEYAQFRSLAEQMDRAPYEVLIEATVAEVTLDKGESLGVLLNFSETDMPIENQISVSSDGGILANLIQDRGDFTAALNAAADKSKVSILSSPRLVAASGKSATMQVGTQVPIITTQQTAPDGSTFGTSNILQQVQYRSTGIVLNIQPIVNSSRRVELTVSQEVSDAQNNDTSNIQSPIILTRGIETTLSVDDGETILLAGLISENFSEGDVGIPFLKDVPLIGNAFKTQSRALQKTELIVLLTPYIIDSQSTAREIRDAFRSKLNNLSESFEKIE
ncbi:MAG: hypothetical protein CBC47_01135 [Alphaproteobacteria bacterium TMED87]|nr:hypothetical protein [Rhodospirillaceae bacterium]OUV11537.1 MAG: hypothetical protein CBC47_01135 [Alphaproteobacteria bacterium TMED87]